MTQLPMTRVRTIMRSSADVENVNKEAVFILAKATEDFLKKLTKEVYNNAKSSSTIHYTQVSEVVHNNEVYEFLREIIPQKITVGQYKKLLHKQSKENGNSPSEVVNISSESDSELDN